MSVNRVGNSVKCLKAVEGVTCWCALTSAQHTQKCVSALEEERMAEALEFRIQCVGGNEVGTIEQGRLDLTIAWGPRTSFAIDLGHGLGGIAKEKIQKGTVGHDNRHRPKNRILPVI